MDVLALSELLRDPEARGDTTGLSNVKETRGSAILTPASFGPLPSDSTESNVAPSRKANIKPAVDDGAIWDPDQVVHKEAIISDPDDKRPRPLHEIYFKQHVGTEDVFLGMSDKTPGSLDCSHIVVKVHFPGCTMKELNLDVTTNRLTAESEDKNLSIYLPHPVDEANGNAQWDNQKEILIVTLPVEREQW